MKVGDLVKFESALEREVFEADPRTEHDSTRLEVVSESR